MTQWIALSRSSHARAGYLPGDGYLHAQGRAMVPVLMAELHKLLPHYALGFVPTEQGMMPVALLGGERNSNLYLHRDGRWLAPYVPAMLRAHPFALSDDHGKGQALCIASENLVEEGGRSLFEDEELSDRVSRTLDFLKECERGRHLALAAGRRLDQAGVLVPWHLTLSRDEGRQRVEGLFRVDEKALNALEGGAFAALRGIPMQLAYAQLFSMSQSEQLERRRALQSTNDDSPPADKEDMFFRDDDEWGFDFGD